MRRIRTLFIVALILLLLLSGCDSAVPPETTIPPETTVPVETTEPVIPVTTIPPVVSTEPAEPVHPDKAQLTADGFVPYEKEYHTNGDGSVYFWEAKYVYAGDSSEIELAIMEMSITLPEGWVDRVWVIQQGSSQDGIGSVYITNRAITEAHREWAIRTYDEFVPDELYGWQDFIVRISRQEKKETEDYSNAFLRDSAGFLGETEKYYYFASLAQNQDPNCSEALLWRSALLRDIGEEAYNALVGDLVLDYDMVREMITIRDETAVPPSTEPELREIDPLYLEMVDAGFEMIQGDPYQSWSEWHYSPDPSRYQYVGDDNTIVFPSASITLTLPEEWKDQLTVTTNRYDDPPYGRLIYVHSSRVLETTIEYFLQDYPSFTRKTMDMPYYDYVLLIEMFPRESHDNMVPEQDPHHPRIGIYLGEDEYYYYFAYLPGDDGSYEIGRINMQNELIGHIGEEAYNALVGDLVLDYDMVREMVTIRDETAGE